MSYGQERNTEQWNNDPNAFHNPGGPDVGVQRGTQASGGYNAGAEDSFNSNSDFQQQQPNRGLESHRSAGWNDQNQSGTRDPTDSSTMGSAGAFDRQNQRDNEREFDRNKFESTGQRDTPQRGADNGLWTAGQGEQYGTTGQPGNNTTDANTFGAGGDHFNRADQNDSFAQERKQGQSRTDQAHAAGEKPSVGDKIMDKLTGRVGGNRH